MAVRLARTVARLPERRGRSPRRWALEACSIDVEHAEREFWSVAHRLGLAPSLDRFLVPTCHLAAALPHERQAGIVLNWLSHLQSQDHEIVRAITRGCIRRDRKYLRALFRRRLALKLGFSKVLARYRALRDSAAEGKFP